LAEKIQILRDEPRPGDSKSIRGFNGYRRADSVKYRVTFRTVSGVAVLLVTILGKRNDGQVYKLFRRLNN